MNTTLGLLHPNCARSIPTITRWWYFLSFYIFFLFFRSFLTLKTRKKEKWTDLKPNWKKNSNCAKQKKKSNRFVNFLYVSYYALQFLTAKIEKKLVFILLSIQQHYFNTMF